MIVYYDGLEGPIACVVVREIDARLVELRYKAAGGFAFLNPPQSTWVEEKRNCWAKCRPLNRFGTRVEYSGCPKWRIPAEMAQNMF